MTNGVLRVINREFNEMLLKINRVFACHVIPVGYETFRNDSFLFFPPRFVRIINVRFSPLRRLPRPLLTLLTLCIHTRTNDKLVFLASRK